MSFFAFDWHSLTHFLGSAVLLRLTARYVIDTTKDGKFFSFIIVFVLGLIWELLDTVYRGILIFDPRGGDWLDVICDFMGCLLGLLL